MTTFAVDLKSLNKFGENLITLSGHGTGNVGVSKALNYVEDWITPAGERTGLFFNFASISDQVQEAINIRLKNMATLLNVAGCEVKLLSKHFDKNEDGAVNELERVAAELEEGNYTRWGPSSGKPSQSPAPVCLADPTGRLTPPSNPEPFPDFVQFIFEDRGLLLKGNVYPWVKKGIDLIWCDWMGNPTNPLEDIMKGVVGDWNKVKLSSGALTNLASYHGDLAGVIEQETAEVIHSWKGKSATAADEYFQSLSSAISAMSPALNTVSGHYNAVASGMWMEAQGIAGVIPAIVFIAQAIAVTAAVTAATAETGVGAVLGALGLGVEAIALINSVITAWNAWCAMIILVDTFCGTTAGYLGAIHSLDTINQVRTIDQNYDSPFV